MQKVYFRSTSVGQIRCCLSSNTAYYLVLAREPASFWRENVVAVVISRELKNHDEVHDDDVCWLGKDWNENLSFGRKKETKMQSVGRSTATTLNVNTNIKLWCSFATRFFAMVSFKTMQDLRHTSNFIADGEFFVLPDLFEWKNTCFPHKDYSTFNLNEMTESECLSEFRFGKRDILMW